MKKPRPLIRLLVLVLAVQLLLPLLLLLLRNRVIFLPGSTPPAAGLGRMGPEVAAEVVQIERPDGRQLGGIDARQAPAYATPGVDGPVVLFFHGNGGDVAMRAEQLEAFVAGTGARTLMFDYSGYGGNPGSPSEEEVYVDGLAAFDHLVAQGIAAERICLYGESLGGAVALHVASERPCAGVVVQSSFASLSSMAWSAYKWLPLAALLTRGDFPSDERIAALQMPVLIVHGDQDGIVPFTHGEALHAAQPAAEFLTIRGAGHNDLFWAAGPRYLRDLGTRFRSWAPPAPPERPQPSPPR